MQKMLSNSLSLSLYCISFWLSFWMLLKDIMEWKWLWIFGRVIFCLTMSFGSGVCHWLLSLKFFFSGSHLLSLSLSLSLGHVLWSNLHGWWLLRDAHLVKMWTRLMQVSIGPVFWPHYNVGFTIHCWVMSSFNF